LRWVGGKHGWQVGCLVWLAAGVMDWRGRGVKILGRIQGWQVCRLYRMLEEVVGCCAICSDFAKEKTHFHDNEHDRRRKHVEMLNQDNNNQDERKYNLRSTWR
jgi:hypothetical protein